jgi:integration host factor subunit alpha
LVLAPKVIPQYRLVHWGWEMTKNTVTRADLCNAVYQKVGLSRTECSAFAELVLKEITDCIERGETVKLSSFGSFVVRKKGQRIGRNPKTGTEVPISPRRVVVFKPSVILKQRINLGSAAAVNLATEAKKWTQAVNLSDTKPD